MITHPNVVKGLKALHKIVHVYRRKRSARIVSEFVLAANLGRVRELMAKLRYQVIRIQRCWRDFRICTLARLRAMQMKFSLVEQSYHIDLMNVIRQGKHLSKREILKSLTQKSRSHKPKQLGSAFNCMERGVKESLLGITAKSPASDGRTGGIDCSGAFMRVARLDTKLAALGDRQLISPSINRQVSRFYGKQKFKNNCRLNNPGKHRIPLWSRQLIEEPPVFIIDGNVRRAQCKLILDAARQDWILERSKQNYDDAGLLAKVTSEQVLAWLGNSNDTNDPIEHSKICEQTRESNRCLRVFLHKRMRWSSLLQLCQELLQHESNRKDSLTSQRDDLSN